MTDACRSNLGISFRILSGMLMAALIDGPDASDVDLELMRVDWRARLGDQALSDVEGGGLMRRPAVRDKTNLDRFAMNGRICYLYVQRNTARLET
mgnify:CR=1 FL=1